MLPRIEAMEQLSAIEASGMAMGSADDPARQERLENLRSLARGEPQKVEDKRPKKASPEQAARMGIGVIIVPAEEPGYV